MKKILLFFAALLLIVSCSKFDETTVAPNHIKRNNNAITAFERFVSSCNQTRAFNINFPCYYGGAYINGDNELTIMITDLSTSNQCELLELTGYNDVYFEQCGYSYNELQQTMNNINCYLLQNNKTSLLDNISSVYINDRLNRVIVELYDCSDEQITFFKNKISDHSALCFMQVENTTRTVNYQSVLQPKVVDPTPTPSYVFSGEKIWSYTTIPLDSLKPASIGYRAKNINGAEGFVTAANIVKYTDIPIMQKEANGTYRNIAYCFNRQDEGNVNAAFCPVLTTLSVSNVLQCDTWGNTQRIITAQTPITPIVNLPIWMFGAQSLSNNGAPSYGVITSSNCTFVGLGNKVFTNVVRTNYSSSGGADCGGVVVWATSSLSTRVVGIHLGTSNTNSYFIPATNINNALNLTIY